MFKELLIWMISLIMFVIATFIFYGTRQMTAGEFLICIILIHSSFSHMFFSGKD